MQDEEEYTDSCKGGIEIPKVLEIDPETNKLEDLLQFGDLATEERKETMINLCKEYQDVFLMPGAKLTTTNAGVFHIETKPDSQPVFIRQYRMDGQSLERLKEFVQKLKEHDIVERSFSPYNSPVFLRGKPGIDEKGRKKK